MTTKSTTTAFGPSAGQALTIRSYHRFLTPEEIEHAAISLEAKRWDAVEWAREHGIRLLKDQHDDEA